MNINKLILIICQGLLLLSCGVSRESKKINSPILQKSQIEVEVNRFYFNTDKDINESFLGHQKVKSFETVNMSDIPEDRAAQYWHFDLLNEEGLVIYSLNQAMRFSNSSQYHEYSVIKFSPKFFIEVPETIPPSSINQIKISTLTTPVQEIGIIPGPYIRSYSQTENAKEEGWNGNLRVLKLFGNHDSSQAYDITVMGDGFTEEEMDTSSDEALLNSKFGQAVKDYVLDILNTPPYSLFKENINIWLVATPSLESGVDIPSEGILKKTTFDSTFDVSCIRRALVPGNNIRVLEMAGHTPFDLPLILVNSTEYGGTGSDIPIFSIGPDAKSLMLHELGHSIALLADEYYYLNDKENISKCEDQIVYESVIKKGNEYGRNNFQQNVDQNLLAPNVTNEIELSKVKWANHFIADSPVPVVHFDFPTKKMSIDKEGQSMSFNFTPQENRDEFYMLVFDEIYSEVNKYLITNMKGISIDETFYDIGQIKLLASESYYSMKDFYFFLQIPSLNLIKDKELKITVHFGDSFPIWENYLSYKEQQGNAYFFTLSSQIFSPQDIGLFQGAGPSLSELYRPTFCSAMLSNKCPWNAIEIEALKNQLLKYSVIHVSDNISQQ